MSNDRATKSHLLGVQFKSILMFCVIVFIFNITFPKKWYIIRMAMKWQNGFTMSLVGHYVTLLSISSMSIRVKNNA